MVVCGENAKEKKKVNEEAGGKVREAERSRSELAEAPGLTLLQAARGGGSSRSLLCMYVDVVERRKKEGQKKEA